MKNWRISALTKWTLYTGLFFLILMTLLRFSMYSWFNRQGSSFAEVFPSFLLGLRFDLRTVAILMCVMLVVGSVPRLSPVRSVLHSRVWISLLVILSFVFLFFYIADFAHYAYLTQRLNASVLNYLEDAAISFGMVWQSYPVFWIILLLATGTIFSWIVLRWLHRRSSRSASMGNKKQIIISKVAFLLVLGILIFGNLSQYPLRWSDAFRLGSDYKANLALNPFESFFSTLQFRSNKYDAAKLKQLYPFLQNYFHFKPTDSAISFTRRISFDSSYDQPPNVVLVICESFSAYKTSYFGNPLNTTPFFDSLCRNGILFDRCFTPAYGTARGVWATITGVPDVESPATASRNPAAVDQHTIINDFTAHEKFYFIGGSTSWANIRGLLNNNIKDLHLYEQDDYNAPKIDVWGISDKNLFLEANRILSASKKPFFAIIQTADNHRPYTIPEEDLGEFQKLNVPFDTLRRYSFESVEEYNAFRYTDFSYRKFMEAASRETYFDNTIFVFIGDHGIPGNAFNLFPKVWTEQRLTQQHVPLLYYGPRFFGHKLVSDVSSQIDVLPTVAGLCKQSYTNTSLGRDLLAADFKKHYSFVFDLDNRQIGAIDNEYFFRKIINTNKEEVFSMKGNEEIDLRQLDPQRVDELRKLAEGSFEASKFLLLNNKKQKVYTVGN